MNSKSDITVQSPTSIPHAVSYDDIHLRNVTDCQQIAPGTTVREWLESSGYADRLNECPTLIVLNGKALEESEFDTVIQEYDILNIVPIPGIADWIVYLGIALTALLAATAFYLAYTVEAPEDHSKKPSPTYDISYRGNQRRPGEPIPVVYGSMRVYPDVTGSYRYYAGKREQWIAQLFDVTQGNANIDPATIHYEDTPLTNFSEYEVEVLQPGEKSTIFPKVVHVSTDVEGIALPDIASEFTVAYAACPAGDRITSIGVDVAAPQGMYRLDDKGRHKSRSQSVTVSIQEIDDLDAPIGIPTEHKIAFHTNRNHPIRHTRTYNVAEGRYEVKVRRGRDHSTGSDVSDALVWTGLRGFSPDDTTTDSTRIAIKARQSDTIGNKAVSKFNVLVNRVLPVWNGSTWSDQQTKSAVWAFADILKSEYGGKRGDAALDLDGLLAIAGDPLDVFNGTFDTSGTVWEALEEVSRPVLARPVQLLGGVYTMVVDKPATIPNAMFTMRNIVQGSLVIEHIGVTQDINDGVRVIYLDEDNDFKENTCDCIPSGMPGVNLKEINLKGVTTNNAAYEVGIRMANENRWRRKRITWETGIEGYIPTLGDTVKVSHFLLSQEDVEFSVSGEVKTVTGNDFTTYEDLSHLVGKTGLKVFLRNKNGEPVGPYNATVPDANTVNASELTGWDVEFSNDKANPLFAIGPATDFMADVKLMKVEQTGINRMKLEGFIDNQNAYVKGTAPTPPTLELPNDLTPKVSDLEATIMGESDSPLLRLTWAGENSDYYIIDESDDIGVTWNRVGETTEEEFTLNPIVASDVRYRVAGVGIFVGPFATVSVDLLSYTKTPADVNGLRPIGTNEGSFFHIGWDALPANYRAEVTVTWNSTVQRTTLLDEGVNEFVYTYQDAQQDDPEMEYGAIVTKQGARICTFTVHTYNDSNEKSITGVSITIENSQIPKLQNVQYYERQGNLFIEFDPVSVTDGHLFEIHVSETVAFTPTPATRAYIGPIGASAINGYMVYDTWYYIKVVAYDVWGRDQLNWSDEHSLLSGSEADPESMFPNGVQDYHLSTDLQARIDLVDTPTTGLVDRMNQAESDIATNLGNINQNINDISQAQTDILANTTNIGTNATNLSTAQADILANANDISDLQGDVLTAQTDITNLESTVNDPVTGVDANSTAIGALDTRVTTAEGTISTQGTDLTNLTSRVTTNEGDISGNASSISSLNTRVTTAEGNISTNATDITALETTVNHETTGVSANASAISTLDGRVTTAEGNISTNSSDITTLENTVNDPSTGVDANATAISGLDVRVTTAEGTITSQGTDITALENTVNDPSTGVDANATAISGLDTRVTTAEGNISTNASDITNLETTVNHPATGVSANATAISGLDTRLTTAEGSISTNASDITALESTVDDPVTGVDANATAIGSLDTRVTTAEGNISSNASEITTLKNTVNNGTTGVVANANAISALDTRVTDNEGDISTNASDISALESTVNNGTTGVAANASAISSLDTRVTTAEGNISTNSSDITALENTVNHGTTGVAANASAISGLDTRITTAEGNISTNSSDITALENTVNHPSTGVSANASAISTLDSRVDSNDTDISGHAGRLTSLETTVNDGATGVNANASAISGLDTRVSTNEGDISGQATDISTLQTTVNNPTTGGTALATAINAAQATADTADGKADANASQISTVSTTVDGHTTSIQTNSTSIGGLEGQYSVKIDTGSGGHVAGFGLSNTASEYSGGAGHSEFLVLVDRFAVASPTATDLSFEVEDGEVRMDGARIKNASVVNAKIANATIEGAKIKDAAITNAKIQDLAVTEGKIQDLAVDTLKIADWAVNQPASASIAQTPDRDNDQWNVELTINYTALNTNSVVRIDASVGRSKWVNDWTHTFRIRRDGTLISPQYNDISFSAVEANDYFVMDSPPSGVQVTYTLEIFHENNTGYSATSRAYDVYFLVNEMRK